MWMETMTRLGALATEPAALAAALAGTLGMVLRQHQKRSRQRVMAGRLHEELMGYMRVEDRCDGDAREIGKRLCRAISRHSAFGAAALLVRDGKGRLTVTASLRADELTICALERWSEGESVRECEQQIGREGNAGHARGVHLVRLERRSGYRPGDPAALAWCTAAILPMCAGKVVTGAIAVCADRFHGQPSEALAVALRPLELLAARFAGTLHATQQGGRRGHVEEPQPVQAAAGRSMPISAAQRTRDRYNREWAHRQELPPAQTTSLPSGPVGRRRSDTNGSVKCIGSRLRMGEGRLARASG